MTESFFASLKTERVFFINYKTREEEKREDYKKCYVPDVAQKVLKRWDKESTHYELIETRNY